MPLQILAEKTRQALGVDGSSCQPISLERYQRALSDADKFAAWLTDYHTHVTALGGALQGFITSTGDAVRSCPLPSCYSERYDTHELRALPHPAPPKAYAHLFSLPDSVPSSTNTPNATGLASPRSTSPSPATAASAAAGGGAGSDLVGLLQGLPTRLHDKFDGHLAVPIELWLQAHREAQARLSALDLLRLKVEAQRIRLLKHGQQFEKKQQERKLRAHTASARSSFEKHTPPSGATSTTAAAAASPTHQAASPEALAAAAAAAFAGAADADFVGSSSESFARSSGSDPALLTTPPSTPMQSFSAFAGNRHGPRVKAAGPNTPEAASGTASDDSSCSNRADRPQRRSAESARESGLDIYAEGLVRLRSFPLVDAPTSVVSSGGNSRRNSAEQAASGAAGGGAVAAKGASAASSPRVEPTLHAALPVPAASSTAGLKPAAAAAGIAPAATGVSSKGAEDTQQLKDDMPAGSREAEVAGDDEESWAAAVVRRHGEQGLLQAHEMVERALGPLLSDFSKVEMQLSTLLGWLVTQAARLRAYFNFILLTSATAVEAWALPPGLLEPFPADKLLREGGHRGSAKHPPAPAQALAEPPAGPTSPEHHHAPRQQGFHNAPAVSTATTSPMPAHTNGGSLATDLHTAPPAGPPARLSDTQQKSRRHADSNSNTSAAAPAGQHSNGTASPASQRHAGVAPQPSRTSTVSVGSAVLAAMVRSLSWKSSGNASRTSSGGSGKQHNSDSHAAVTVGGKGGPLGEGVLTTSSRAADTHPGPFAGGPEPTATASAAGAVVAGPSAAGSDLLGPAAEMLSTTGDTTSSSTRHTQGQAQLHLPSADMSYLAQDRALIASLSERALCETCSTTDTTDTEARRTAAGSAMPAHDTAAGTEGSAGQDAGFRGAPGGEAVEGREGIVLGAAGARGLEMSHRREQLLQRAAELEAEAATHSAAAAEAARIAAASADEAAELEVRLKRDVTVKRSRLLEQHEAVSAELSQLEASVLAGLQQSAADAERQLREVKHQLDSLAPEEVESEYSRLNSRHVAVSTTLGTLEARRQELEQQVSQAQTELASRYKEAQHQEAEVSRLTEEVSSAEGANTKASEAVTALQTEVESSTVRLSELQPELESHTANLAQLVDVRLPQVNKQLHAIQAQLRDMKPKTEIEASLSTVQHELQEVQQQVERWSSKSRSVSTLLTELSAQAHTFSCEAAAAKAQAMGARGLQTAEEARAAAAGAEAQALRAAAAAMRDSGITFSAAAAAGGTMSSRTAVAASAAPALKTTAVLEPSHGLPAAAGAAGTDAKAARIEDRLMDSSSSLTDGRTAGMAAAAVVAGGSRQTGEFAGPATRLSAAQQKEVCASTAEGHRHRHRRHHAAVDEATQTAEPPVSTVAAAAGKEEFSQALGPLGGPDRVATGTGMALQEPARLAGAAAGARTEAEEVRGPPAMIAAPPAAAAEMSEQMVVPASPVGGASVSSSTRERRHRHSLKHWRPHKAEEHFYLPLGGLDVDVGHAEDQMLLPHHPAPSSAGPARMELSEAGVAASTRPAAVSSSPPAAQRADVTPAPGGRHERGQHGTAGQLMQLQQLPGSTRPLGGPMGGEPGTGASEIDMPAAVAPTAAAPAGSEGYEMMAGGGGASMVPSGHKGRRHRRAEAATSMGTEQPAAYVPGPLEAGGGTWSGSRGYQAY